jgi:TolB-like protein/thioredoxin-like negative regulator of GroEL
MAVEEVVSLGVALADALAEVHALGIVHRDLKPSNIMLTSRGPRILDFGVARVQASPTMTAAGAVIGTPVAMSPEQINGMNPDNRADLWSLGVVLYQALAGRLPFEGQTYESIFRNVLHHEPDAPGALRPGVPAELDHVVLKLLRKEASHRYPRAEDLIADLDAVRAALPSGESLPTRTFIARPSVVPRLAVLPFEMLSADPSDALLASGLVEDLIVDLTRIQGLRVASRAEVAGFAARNVPPRTLARELGVDHVMSGSVRRLGNRARINAQLVRASDGHILWAERFDRNLDDLFHVQEEVSGRIVEALQVALKPGEREILGRAPAKNTEAYALYLSARGLLASTRDESFRAERLLRQALEIDPEFALATAALAECLAQRAFMWWAGTEVVEPALQLIARARELAPGLPEIDNVELMVRRIEGDPAHVLAAIEKVLATNPDDGQARELAGWCYMSLGQPEKALPILEGLRDRYMALGWLTDCYVMLDRRDDARAVNRVLLDRLVEIVGKDAGATHPRSLLGIGLVKTGQVEAGLAQADRAVALNPGDNRIRYNAACANAQAGRTEEAIAHLKAAVANLPDYVVVWPLRDPDLASLRDHPEFVRMFGKA